MKDRPIFTEICVKHVNSLVSILLGKITRARKTAKIYFTLASNAQYNTVSRKTLAL